MGSQYTIIIENLTGTNASFYAFQQQAQFSGSTDSDPSSNCLATGVLAPNSTSGAQLIFAFDTRNYAGAMCRNPSNTNTVAFFALVGCQNTVSLAKAAQPVGLTTSSQSDNSTNFSVMSLNPLGLSSPVHQVGLKPGTFGIQIPVFSPGSVEGLACGCAVIDQNSTITLSSFVVPAPNSQIMCAPTPVFYVKAGAATVGKAIVYDTANAAKCDFSSGLSVLTVHYNADGTVTLGDTS